MLDDLKERGRYAYVKEEAVWRARCGRGFGLVVRQTMK
jgi:hypothetical protein